MKKYKISIIVAIYNIAEFLEKCLLSIINQTYKNLEIILVDDGSTDSSGDICDQFAQNDKRIKVIHKKNGGLVSARKAGLENASGDYIAVVDGDDWLELNMYEKLLSSAIEYDADFVESGYFEDYPNKTIIRPLSNQYIKLSDEAKKEIIVSWFKDSNSCLIRNAIWCKLYKREIIQRSYKGVIESFGEDMINFAHLINISKKCAVVSDCFYHYKIRDNSLSRANNKSPYYFKINIALFESLNVFFCKHFPSISDAADKWLLVRAWADIARILDLNNRSCIYYSFPDVTILFDKKIAIYGAGKVGQAYVEQLSKYERINTCLWVDRQFENFSFAYRTVKPIEDLLTSSYDFIIIAVLKKPLADEIKQQLIDLGISKDKIIWIEPEKPREKIFSSMINPYNLLSEL